MAPKTTTLLVIGGGPGGYVAAIQRQVQARWRKPLNWPPGMNCDLRVKLLPSGEVISAQAVSCGNDPAFVESKDGAFLHRFTWLKDEQIGAVLQY